MGIRGPVYQARQNKVEIQDVCPKLSEKSVTPKSNFFNDDCLTMYSLPYVVFWRICHKISQFLDKGNRVGHIFNFQELTNGVGKDI
jgi:hypothetical protein